MELIRGDSVNIHFQIEDTGTPLDLTDTTVYFTAKPGLTNDITDSTAVMLVEVTDHTDPTNGVTDIPLSSTVTDVTPALYYYDIQIERDGNIITSIPYRTLEVIPDVTRRTS